MLSKNAGHLSGPSLNKMKIMLRKYNIWFWFVIIFPVHDHVLGNGVDMAWIVTVVGRIIRCSPLHWQYCRVTVLFKPRDRGRSFWFIRKFFHDHQIIIIAILSPVISSITTKFTNNTQLSVNFYICMCMCLDDANSSQHSHKQEEKMEGGREREKKRTEKMKTFCIMKKDRKWIGNKE